MIELLHSRGPIEADPDEVREGDAIGGAALGLLALMTGLSEEHWCAGWMGGLEFSLWRIRENVDAEFPDSISGLGMGRVTERQRELLRLLSDECDGWWAWIADGPRFVALNDWRAHFVSERRP